MSDVVATRFPKETIDELDAVARARRRTRAEIVREAVALYLARWADYAIALDRLHAPCASSALLPATCGSSTRPRGAPCAQRSTTGSPPTPGAESD